MKQIELLIHDDKDVYGFCELVVTSLDISEVVFRKSDNGVIRELVRLNGNEISIVHRVYVHTGKHLERIVWKQETDKLQMLALFVKLRDAVERTMKNPIGSPWSEE